MTLPDKIHKQAENDYKYYDDEGNMIPKNSYQHWYKSVSYILIWEGKYDSRELPAVYERNGDSLEYNRLQHKELTEAIADDFWMKVSQPLQTDGPAWYYEQNKHAAGMMGFTDMMLKRAQEELNKANKISSRAGDKFCRNCGAALKKTAKFCEECGTEIIC